MTKEQARQEAAILNAFADDEPIQYITVSGEWCDVTDGLDWADPEYIEWLRIKPNQ